MGLFVEYHLIQNFAPANLNRDDTGAPKDAIFGGHRRARVSSQCFKRAIRLQAAETNAIPPEFRGVRTKKLAKLLGEELKALNRSEAADKIEVALAGVGLRLDEKRDTEYLLFLGRQEVAALAALIDRHWDALRPQPAGDGKKRTKKEGKAGVPEELLKEAKKLLDGGKAVDVALFGRMLADQPALNQDAACQVAHALSTHKVDREFDYFTAVDDEGEVDETAS